MALKCFFLPADIFLITRVLGGIIFFTPANKGAMNE